MWSPYIGLLSLSSLGLLLPHLSSFFFNPSPAGLRGPRDCRRQWRPLPVVAEPRVMRLTSTPSYTSSVFARGRHPKLARLPCYLSKPSLCIPVHRRPCPDGFSSSTFPWWGSSVHVDHAGACFAAIRLVTGEVRRGQWPAAHELDLSYGARRREGGDMWDPHLRVHVTAQSTCDVSFWGMTWLILNLDGI